MGLSTTRLALLVLTLALAVALAVLTGDVPPVGDMKEWGWNELP